MRNEKTEQATHRTGEEEPQNEKLLRLETGYDQHASHLQLNSDPSTARVFTVLWEMKKKGLRDRKSPLKGVLYSSLLVLR
jgi:hypothetical protein